MSHLMYHPDNGFHHFYDEELDLANKSGWVDGEKIRSDMLSSENSVVAKPDEEVTITPQRRAGRPRKTFEVPSILNDGDSYANSAEPD